MEVTTSAEALRRQRGRPGRFSDHAGYNMNPTKTHAGAPVAVTIPFWHRHNALCLNSAFPARTLSLSPVLDVQVDSPTT